MIPTNEEIIQDLPSYGGLVQRHIDATPTIADWIRSLPSAPPHSFGGGTIAIDLGIQPGGIEPARWARTRESFDQWGYFSITAYLHDLHDLKNTPWFSVVAPPIDVSGPGLVEWLKRWGDLFPTTMAEVEYQYEKTGVPYVSMFIFAKEFIDKPTDIRLAIIDDPPPIELPGWMPSEIIIGRPADLSILYAEETRAKLTAAETEIQAAAQETQNTIQQAVDIVTAPKSSLPGGLSMSAYLIAAGVALGAWWLFRRKR